MSDRIYDGYLLCGDSHAVQAMGISIATGANLDNELASERIALSMDARIPANCAGYVRDLVSGLGSRTWKIDRLKMLARHVPISMPS